MSNVKDVDLPRHAWDTPPFLLIVSPTPPVQSVHEYVRTLGQSRDNETKGGWPYSMSMGLARGSPASNELLSGRINNNTDKDSCWYSYW